MRSLPQYVSEAFTKHAGTWPWAFFTAGTESAAAEARRPLAGLAGIRYVSCDCIAMTEERMRSAVVRLESLEDLAQNDGGRVGGSWWNGRWWGSGRVVGHQAVAMRTKKTRTGEPRRLFQSKTLSFCPRSHREVAGQQGRIGTPMRNTFPNTSFTEAIGAEKRSSRHVMCAAANPEID